jgi:hypothetical protein
VGVVCLFDCLSVRSSYPCLGVLSLGLSLEPWEHSFVRRLEVTVSRRRRFSITIVYVIQHEFLEPYVYWGPIITYEFS